jgi:hypothetical protein
MENLHELGNQIERLTRAGDKDAVLSQLLTLTDNSSRLYAISVNGPTGARTLGDEIKPPRPAKLQVSTLTGFVDAVKAGVAALSGRIVHVEDYLTVSVKATTCDNYGIRDTLLTAKHTPLDIFKFNEYYNDPAKFIIALQSAFYNVENSNGTSNLMWLVQVCSHLKASESVDVHDDGKSQVVTVKMGEVGSTDVSIPPRIKLTPRTTFDEAAPVEREFLLRFAKSQTGSPTIALFAVDGNKWQGESMLAIASYLKKELPEGAVILA